MVNISPIQLLWSWYVASLYRNIDTQNHIKDVYVAILVDITFATEANISQRSLNIHLLSINV